jgi:hypothetical protein
MRKVQKRHWMENLSKIDKSKSALQFMEQQLRFRFQHRFYFKKKILGQRVVTGGFQ